MLRRSFVVGVGASVLACGRDPGDGPARRRRRGGEPSTAPALPRAELPVAAVRPAGARIASEALLARAEALRARLDGRGFTVLVEPPFVVIGDEAPATVQRRAATTIRWAVTRLREDYFPADPASIVEIYLFADEASYRGHARELFAEQPETPYGYYSPAHDALIMNISTGGGTLVHEIVHPFVAGNFPACPTWFNEGLASLYEQCDEQDGHIVGRTNWRLIGLQSAIRRNRLGSTEALCRTTRDEFYDRDPGTNYAQARYLCYWLQEHGRLQDFYHALVRRIDADPGGYATLRDAARVDDMSRFDAEWRRFVLGLRYGHQLDEP